MAPARQLLGASRSENSQPDVDIADSTVKFVRWPYKTRRWVDRVDADITVPGSTRMSFERPAGAGSRADQSTVRRANLGVVLKQIAAGEPRSRARVAAETGLTRGHRLEPRRRADRARPAARDRRGRARGPGRPAGPDARARRPDRCDRARGQRRLPRGLRRGPDRARSATSAACTPTTGAPRRARC